MRLTKPFVAALVSTVLALSACGYGNVPSQENEAGAGSVDVQPTPSTAPVPENLKKYYEQSFSWGECPDDVTGGGNAKCATFEVPKDYQNPDDDKIKIMAVRVSKGDEPRNAIMVNPGGPGGSAVDFVAEHASAIFTPQVLEKFDVVGMDSRGTKWSTPVDCLTDEELDKQLSRPGPDVTTVSGREELRDELAKVGQKCLDNGDIVKFVDTESAARDMDILRHLMGQQKLDYLGFSYGTFLGATYADLFPQNVERMVLDGAVDPTISFDELSKLQLAGFDASLRHFVDWCHGFVKGCFLEEGDAGKQQIGDFLQSLKVRPLPTDDPDRDLTSALGETAVLGAMYSDNWFQTLYQGLEQGMRFSDGAVLLKIADVLNERNGDGTFNSNQTEAFLAINNLDYPVRGDEQTWAKDAEEMQQISPLLWQTFAWGDFARSQWPVKPVGTRVARHAKGAPPIMVIGTTHDPATPMVMAEALAKQLDSGFLVTQEGWNHTAYSSVAGACVRNAVDNYFLKGEVPAKDLVCSN